MVKYCFFGACRHIPSVAHHINKFSGWVILPDHRHVIDHKRAFTTPPGFTSALPVLLVYSKTYADQISCFGQAEYLFLIKAYPPGIGMQSDCSHHIPDKLPEIFIPTVLNIFETGIPLLLFITDPSEYTQVEVAFGIEDAPETEHETDWFKNILPLPGEFVWLVKQIKFESGQESVAIIVV